MIEKSKIRGGIYGLLLGDAAGVPYEFNPPANLAPHADRIDMAPPPGFRRTYSGLPVGTWSDDGALALCLLESLVETGVSDNVRVGEWTSGLLVDYCRQVGAKVLVKGVRSGEDVAYETPMAIMNRSLAGVETVFLLPDPAHAHVSSSLVRQVASLGGDVSPYVPAAVAAYLSTT